MGLLTPGSLSPREAELNILKSFGTNGRFTFEKPGTLISIEGDAGTPTYIEASAIPSVNVLYVGTTKKSSFVAMLFKIIMPED